VHLSPCPLESPLVCPTKPAWEATHSSLPISI
jgi:hypothetical protein